MKQANETYKADSRIECGSVVQANERAPEGWRGCLMVVCEIKPTCVMTGLRMPQGGDAYMRFAPDALDYIGHAAFMPPLDMIGLESEAVT